MPKITRSYGLTNPLQNVFPEPIISKRSPTEKDTNYSLGQQWVDSSSNNVFFLTNVEDSLATWENVTTLITSDIAFTPYIVGDLPGAPFQTIQSALDAANAAGGGTVVVQDGMFVEDLTLYANVSIFGTSIFNTSIDGTHTPPSSGNFSINNCTLLDGTSIISSVAAGTGTIFMYDCIVNVSNGTCFNIPNWEGTLFIFNFTTIGTVDSFLINNSTLATRVNSSTIGIGVGASISTSGGQLFLTDCVVGSGIEAEGTTEFFYQSCAFGGQVESIDDTTGSAIGCLFEGGIASAFFFSSNLDCELTNCTFSSTNANVISGNATAGKLGINNCSFTQNTTIAAAINIEDTEGASRSTFVHTKSLGIQETGTNDFMGTVVLVAGAATVPTTRVQANSRIFLTSQVDGGTPGFLRISARTPLTDFTITSSDGADTSAIGWMIVSPFAN